ncbi:MAG TPA: tripartite tricarboxylate transporter substrate-binding protein [Burkholderiales bacterium]|nr:tripartite tricarboxylate transporter substrate-binding protein [Burkholderiales bacterium]
MISIRFGSVSLVAARTETSRSGWGCQLRRVCLFFSAGLALVGAAAAQDYPARQILLIAPFPAGGATDVLARILGEGMRPTLGQQSVVLNLAGAGSTIGVGRAIQATPDGYTLVVGNWTSHVGAPAVYKVPWHPLTDLEPISMLSVSTLIIAGRTNLPQNDGKELIAWLKANPDQATVATVGAGSGAHVCALYFEQKIGTRFRYVPYKGGAPAMADLMANQVDLFCGEASQMLSFFKSGRIKPLVVMSKSRWRPMPEVPTAVELGATDTYIPFWHGLWAPKGTPKQVVAKVNDAVVKAFSDPVVMKRIDDLGQDIPPREQLTPQALRAFHKSEIDKWWPLIKAANIKVE